MKSTDQPMTFFNRLPLSPFRNHAYRVSVLVVNVLLTWLTLAACGGCFFLTELNFTSIPTPPQ